MLKRKQIPGMGGEWFRCTVDDVRAAVLAVRTRTTNVEDRTRDFPMRPEQREAVDKTTAYFRSVYGVITVTFDGVDKRFQFPGAIMQGFLNMESVL